MSSRVERGSGDVHVKRPPSAPPLYTIGHSTRSLRELIDVLQAFGVTRLVDIRSIPRSRTNPQFNADVLPAALHGAGIAYVLLAALGGRRSKARGVAEDVNAGWRLRPFHNYADYAETAPFRAGLRELLALVSGETCAVMCAEAVWWRCHRRIVTDHALARGVRVVHLFTATKAEPATMTPFAVIGARGRVSYPAPVPARGAPAGHAGTGVATSDAIMPRARSALRVGDHVSWSSEAGRVRGVIRKRLTRPTKLKGYIVRASEAEPQYVIESDKTDHIAVHKGSALRKLRGPRPSA
jgi:hypothetical protein